MHCVIQEKVKKFENLEINFKKNLIMHHQTLKMPHYNFKKKKLKFELPNFLCEIAPRSFENYLKGNL